MISKVNRPASLKLVPQAKAMENDPGSSQGSGMAYDGPPQGGSGNGSKSDPAEKKENDSPPLSVVTSVEQIGMTEVVKDLLENKAESPPVNAGLTTTRYSSSSSVAKASLLNRNPVCFLSVGINSLHANIILRIVIHCQTIFVIDT